MYKKSNEYTLKEALEDFLNIYRMNGKINETRIIQAWEKVCGPMISRHTENLYIKNQTLFVKVDTAALKNELSFAKTKLLQALNAAVKEEVIKEIVLT
jgi:predicted nucleic acid-binding Zn ribbon protein